MFKISPELVGALEQNLHGYNSGHIEDLIRLWSLSYFQGHSRAK